MSTCDDLRLGGTLSATGIAGGLSINNTAVSVTDWSGVLGNPGLAYTPVEVASRPGAFIVGDGLPRGRLLTLNMQITRWGPVNYAQVEATSEDQLVANTDDFLALLQAPQYLEVTLPDASLRFLQVVPLDPAIVEQSRRLRTIGVPLFSPMAYWHAGGNQSTDTIAAADTLVVGGNVNVYDAVLTFSGDGTFTHSTLAWDIEIAGSSGAVVVDLGARTVTQAGIPAEDLLVRSDAVWGYFTPGNNSVTSDVSVGVTWRNQFA